MPNIDDPRCANDYYDKGPYVNGGTADVLSTSEVWGVSGTASLDLSDSVTLKSITAYRSTQSRGIRDADNTPFLIITTDVGAKSKQFSQELQLQYDSGPVSGILGGYYFDEDTNERATVPLSFPPSPPVIASILAGGPGTRDLQFSNSRRSRSRPSARSPTSSTSALEMTGGLRYTEDRKTLSGHGAQSVPGDPARPESAADARRFPTAGRCSSTRRRTRTPSRR